MFPPLLKAKFPEAEKGQTRDKVAAAIKTQGIKSPLRKHYLNGKKVAELKPFPVRDIRANVVSKLTERIQEGYNPARPLSVVRNNGNYIVADGNHRLKVLQELGIEEVPCLIRDGDPYKVAVECNADEDTYAPMDLFDWLDIIGRLRDEGLTQAEIGEKIGWSRTKVADYARLIENTVANVLELAKVYQSGRTTENVAIATFTEGWFRNSGLYALCEKYQLRLTEGYSSGGNISTAGIRQKISASRSGETVETLPPSQHEEKIKTLE